MHCPSCGQYVTNGQFCTNCGTSLTQPEESTEHVNKAEEYKTSPEEATSSPPSPSEAFGEKIKRTSGDFGHFLATLIQKPSEARRANQSDMISGIITMVLFALLLAFSYLAVLNTIPTGFYGPMLFIDGFLLPFITILLLEFLIAGLTFAGARLAVQRSTFSVVIAKYGAYLVPFGLLFIISLILFLIGIPIFAGILVLISLLGFLLIAPAFIFMEHAPDGFDRIYVLIGLFIIVMLVFSLFVQSFLASVLSSITNSFFNG
ncbi:hypothetical protein GCM10028778_25720 [Barrientosiimonas marina]|uniref:Zinc ribbon domain-containing protein n=1 Tax=Lentibacillus kimchii TaxID=1542911 RepID=A0ABW2UUX5_9BACI